MASSKTPPFSKYIVYVDESGDHMLQEQDPNYRIFVLAFCVFHKKHYSERVVPNIEMLKFKHFGHDQVVLHERDIRKATNQFTLLRNPAVRSAFFEELSETVSDSNFILISCVVDKRRLLTRSSADENIYHLALASCLETLYDFLEEKDQHRQTTHVVVESRGRKEDRDLELEFRRVCDRNNSRSELLPFQVIFSDKKTMSSGLQMADLVARPIGMKYLRPEQENRTYSVLEKKFFCEGGRENVGEGYEGMGLKIYPPQ